jgi:hypothetical protein
MCRMINQLNLFLYFLNGRNELPAMPAKPATNPPIKPVISTSSMVAPPNGNSCAIFLASMPSLFMSIHNDKIPHNKNIPIKPDRNPVLLACGIKAVTINAMTAMLHHGRNNPHKKDSTAINKTDSNNFI